MSNINIAQLKLRKEAYLKAADLVEAMTEYAYTRTKNSRLLLELRAITSDGLPLPSGRWGNAIALALEINNYIAAEYLINNASALNLETETVVSELGNTNPWGIKDEYLFSLLTYDKDTRDQYPSESDEDYRKYLYYDFANLTSSKSIEARFNITKEDKAMLPNDGNVK